MSVEIPIAKNSDGKSFLPSEAKENGGKFYCPECDGQVVAKCGKVNKHHFAHHNADSHCSGGESIEHLLAKHYVEKFIDKFNINDKCKICKTLIQKIKFEDCKTKDEYTFGKYRLDVGILKDNKLYAAIEVKHTHSVDQEKKDYLNNSHIKDMWFEIKSSKIISAAEKGTFQLSFTSDKECEKCTEISKLKCEAHNVINFLQGIYPFPTLFLNVPYKEKDSAKMLGAKWHTDKKKWYTKDLKSMINCCKWIESEKLRKMFDLVKCEIPAGKQELNEVKSELFTKYAEYPSQLKEFNFYRIDKISENSAKELKWKFENDKHYELFCPDCKVSKVCECCGSVTESSRYCGNFIKDLNFTFDDDYKPDWEEVILCGECWSGSQIVVRGMNFKRFSYMEKDCYTCNR